MAARMSPGESIVGRDIRSYWDENLPRTVVGVVDDARYRPPTEGTGLDLYVSPFQRGHINGYALVRTSVDPMSVAAAAEMGSAEYCC